MTVIPSEYLATRIIGGFFGVCIIFMFVIGIAYDITKKAIHEFTKKNNINNMDKKDNPNNDDKNSSSSSSTPISMDIYIMIYSTLFLILIHILLLTFNFIFASSQSHCTRFTKINVIIFILIRCLMYTILLRRIQGIYQDTMFELKKCHAFILYTIISSYSMIPIMIYLNLPLQTPLISTKYTGQFGCGLYTNNRYLTFTISLTDIIMAGYCLYLFIYPLYRLIKSQEYKHISYNLYQVMIKFSVLYLTSIFSSIILIAISGMVSVGYNYSIIDNFINGIVLIFLHPIHNKSYKTTCCLFHKFCAILCAAPTSNDMMDKSTAERLQQIQQTVTRITKQQQIDKESTIQNQVQDSKVMVIPLKSPQSPTIQSEIINFPKPKTKVALAQNVRNLMKQRAKQRFRNQSKETDINWSGIPLPSKTPSPRSSDIIVSPPLSLQPSATYEEEKDIVDAIEFELSQTEVVVSDDDNNHNQQQQKQERPQLEDDRIMLDAIMSELSKVPSLPQSPRFMKTIIKSPKNGQKKIGIIPDGAVVTVQKTRSLDTFTCGPDLPPELVGVSPDDDDDDMEEIENAPAIILRAITGETNKNGEGITDIKQRNPRNLYMDELNEQHDELPSTALDIVTSDLSESEPIPMSPEKMSPLDQEKSGNHAGIDSGDYYGDMNMDDDMRMISGSMDVHVSLQMSFSNTLKFINFESTHL